jgi:hypothetical protein
MKIVVNISGELIDIDMELFSGWKIREKTLIGDTYFMRTQSGDYFSISKNYYHQYLTQLRNIRIDRVLGD